MALTRIISQPKLHKMFEDEEKGLYDLHWIRNADIEGLRYSVYRDRKTGKYYATNISRCVHMGFNSNEAGKEEEFAEIMKREGRCQASWGVTGRTAHKLLAIQLGKKFPQYRFEIDDNYKCEAFDDHRLVLMPGFEPEVEI